MSLPPVTPTFGRRIGLALALVIGASAAALQFQTMSSYNKVMHSEVPSANLPIIITPTNEVKSQTSNSKDEVCIDCKPPPPPEWWPKDNKP